MTKGICKDDTCPRNAFLRGLCRKHYEQWLRGREGQVKRYFVYALLDPRTDEIRYLGCCKGPVYMRRNSHIGEARTGWRDNPRLRWLREMLAEGAKPIALTLAVYDDPDTAAAAEVWWISTLRADGVALTNATSGGKGLRNPTPETRAKLRARPQVGFKEAAWRAGQAALAAKRGEMYPPSPEILAERKAKQAAQDKARNEERLLARWGSHEAYAEWKRQNTIAMGKRNAGRTWSPEQRAQIAESLRRAYAEGRATPPLKGHNHSEETRAKMRAAWQRRKGVVPE